MSRGMAKEAGRSSGDSSWTYLTNHTHVVVCLARDPDARVRDVAAQVGLTERAVHAILRDLERSGAVIRTRDGRRNHYQVNGNVPLRHPMEGKTDLATLLGAVMGDRGARGSGRSSRSARADASVPRLSADGGKKRARGGSAHVRRRRTAARSNGGS